MQKTNRLYGLLLFFYLLQLLFLSSNIKASEEAIRKHILDATAGKTELSKISSILNTAKINTVDKQRTNNPFIRTDNNNHIQVYLYLEYIDDYAIDQLESNDFKIEIINEDFNIIQGWIDISKLTELSNYNFVKAIKPPVYGILKQGSTTTEGDMVLNSDAVREELGITGKGINVGVISNGIDSLSASQDTGDLPDNICVADSGDGDEGTALLEIIHDIAPGAELSFSEGFSSSLAFIKSIDDLINICDVDIIVDDVGFLLEPYFQDGPVAQKVEEAFNKGVIFVSAAGNSAEEHYQKEYFDENISDNELNLHDFGQADGTMSELSMPLLVRVNQFAPNNFIAVILQWNDPFGLSDNDYDLFLFDKDNNLLDSSTANQNGNDDPIEFVVFENNSEQTVPVNLVINKFSGTSKILEINFNGIIAVEDFNVPEDSIFGHAAAEHAITVAAVPYSDPDQIEDYSSRGPVSIIAGNNNDFEVRLKPTLTGVDETSTSLPGFNPFSGTSAAAPHVAGVIALILDAAPALLNSDANVNSSSNITKRVSDIDSVLDILRDTSIDLGTPGDDITFGSGRVDALAAVEEAIARFGGDDGGGDDDPPDDNENDNGNSSGGCNLITDHSDINSSASSLGMMIIAVLLAISARKFKNNL